MIASRFVRRRMARRRGIAQSTHHLFLGKKFRAPTVTICPIQRMSQSPSSAFLLTLWVQGLGWRSQSIADLESGCMHHLLDRAQRIDTWPNAIPQACVAGPIEPDCYLQRNRWLFRDH